MRIVLSRKGFDTGSGGAPSPIVDGRPISLPIPARQRSTTTFDSLGLGDLVEASTSGKIGRLHLCHEDPMFADGECYFGQCGAAQSHLRNQGVTIGDVFLFFGLFAEETTGERHHRIFGFLRIAEIRQLGKLAAEPSVYPGLPSHHPHLLGSSFSNNTIYRGIGKLARSATDKLRLTQVGGPLMKWDVPGWLGEFGLSYHRKPERWFAKRKLEIVARGQEFVTDIADAYEPRQWLESMIREIGQ